MIDNIEHTLKIEPQLAVLNEKPRNELAIEVVNAVVFDEQGQALVLENQTLEQPVGKWAMLEAFITQSDDPLTAVQAALLTLTGFKTQQWNYIGTYMRNSDQKDGIGHLFVAQSAKKCREPEPSLKNNVATQWIPIEELRYGLIDGRILSTRYALNVALALLMMT